MRILLHDPLDPLQDGVTTALDGDAVEDGCPPVIPIEIREVRMYEYIGFQDGVAHYKRQESE